jgi:hypothetical protein
VLLSPHVLVSYTLCEVQEDGFALFFFPGGSEESELLSQYVKELSSQGWEK